MQPKTMEYYDWFEDIEPKILENLNKLLAEKNIEELNANAERDINNVGSRRLGTGYRIDPRFTWKTKMGFWRI